MRPRDIWRLGVGRTFQIAATFNSMTVLENVQMALVSRERKLFGLWKPAGSWYADEAISAARTGRHGGARESRMRRAGLWRRQAGRAGHCLANRPKLLLMDEPTAGMAPKERNDLMALTKRLVTSTSSACCSPSTAWTWCSLTPTG
jgi:branched-chain amino acid transport system ATP-binding protein